MAPKKKPAAPAAKTATPAAEKNDQKNEQPTNEKAEDAPALVEDGDEEGDEQKEDKKKHNTGAKDLDRMTDFEEEREIVATGGKLEAVMKSYVEREKQMQLEKAQREKVLAAVQINKDDVDLLANEFELSKETAERKLRENDGNVAATMKSLLVA